MYFTAGMLSKRRKRSSHDGEQVPNVRNPFLEICKINLNDASAAVEERDQEKEMPLPKELVLDKSSIKNLKLIAAGLLVLSTMLHIDIL